MRAETRPDPADEGVVDFSEYFRVLARRKWLVLACTLLGLLAGLAYTHAKGASYSSSARVIVQGALDPAVGIDTTKTPNIASEMAIATSSDVAKLAQARLKTQTPPGQLLSNLKVTAPSKSTVMTFAYTAGDKTSAQSGAQAFADSYLQNRANQVAAAKAGRIKNLQLRLKPIQASLAKVLDQLATATKGSSDALTLTNQQQTLTSSYNTLNGQLTQAQGQPVDPSRVITPATKPQPAGLPSIVLLLAGALVGFVIGIVAAFVRDRFDDRVRRESDLDRSAFSPVLSTIPGRPRPGSGALAMLDPAAESRDAYGRLLARLLVAGRRDDVRVLMLTSPVRDRDTTVVASNLAIAMAQAGHRTALVSAIIGDPSFSEMFSLPDGPGLTDVVDAQARVEDALVPFGPMDRLQVMSSGTDPAGMSSLLNAEQTRALFAQLRTRVDYVVVAAPAVLVTSDALLLAGVADGTVLVAESAGTRRPDLMEAEARLEQVGAHEIGIVITGGRVSRASRRLASQRRPGGPPRASRIGGRTAPTAPTGTAGSEVLQS